MIFMEKVMCFFMLLSCVMDFSSTEHLLLVVLPFSIVTIKMIFNITGKVIQIPKLCFEKTKQVMKMATKQTDSEYKIKRKPSDNVKSEAKSNSEVLLKTISLHEPALDNPDSSELTLCKQCQHKVDVNHVEPKYSPITVWRTTSLITDYSTISTRLFPLKSSLFSLKSPSLSDVTPPSLPIVSSDVPVPVVVIPVAPIIPIPPVVPDTPEVPPTLPVTTPPTGVPPPPLPPGVPPPPPPPPPMGSNKPAPPPVFKNEQEKRVYELRQNAKQLKWEEIDNRKYKDSIWEEIHEMIPTHKEKIEEQKLLERFQKDPPKNLKNKNKEDDSKKTVLDSKKVLNLFRTRNAVNVNYCSETIRDCKTITLAKYRVTEEQLQNALVDAILPEDITPQFFACISGYLPDETEEKKLREEYDFLQAKLKNGYIIDPDHLGYILCKDPLYKVKVETLAFQVGFTDKISFIHETIQVLKDAVTDVNTCKNLKKLMMYLLMAGNVLNTKCGKGFSLNVLEKITYVKSKGTGDNFLTNLIKELEEKDPDVLNFKDDLKNIDKAGKISKEDVASLLSALSKSMTDIKELLGDFESEKLQEYIASKCKELEETEASLEDFHNQLKTLMTKFAANDKENFLATVSVFKSNFVKAYNEFKYPKPKGHANMPKSIYMY